MNRGKFDQFMEKGCRPSQYHPEFLTFLEICETYLKKKNIENPVAVELGVWKNAQKKFYEKLLGIEHISIDFAHRRGKPDIFGDTHDPNVMKALKKRLQGRPITILFIDAGHSYEDVKKDFELYSPLCSGIIALHDIELHRHDGHKDIQVWKFWDELKLSASTGHRKYKHFLFLSIFKYRGARVQMGIGVIIKE